MNIYLVDEDGEQNCIKANTMKEAIDICLNSYLEEMEDIEGVAYMKRDESQCYFDTILQSCSFIGRLVN